MDNKVVSKERNNLLHPTNTYHQIKDKDRDKDKIKIHSDHSDLANRATNLLPVSMIKPATNINIHKFNFIEIHYKTIKL